MVYTLGDAAKATGKSKATISKAIKSGRISATKDETGTFQIDPAELHRAFPFQSQNQSLDQSSEPQPTSAENQPEPADLASKREIELLREMLGKAEANADHWRALAERQQALLEDKRPKEPRSLLQRLFGR